MKIEPRDYQIKTRDSIKLNQHSEFQYFNKINNNM